MSEIGEPSCFSAIASQSQSLRQVWKRFYVQDAEVIRGQIREATEYLCREQMRHFLAGIAAAGVLM